MSKEVEDFLAHYGKKGMKWGRRSYSDRVSSYKTQIEKRGANKARTMASVKFVGKFAAVKVAEIAVNKSVRGVGYYNPKTMRGVAFQMNPVAASYIKNLLFVMKIKNYFDLARDGYAIDDAEKEYTREQKKLAKEAKNG